MQNLDDREQEIADLYYIFNYYELPFELNTSCGHFVVFNNQTRFANVVSSCWAGHYSWAATLLSQLKREFDGKIY